MTVTLSLAQRFPIDTKVQVYEAEAWGVHEFPPDGPPPKGARVVARSKMHGDGAKFGTTVKKGKAYVAYAEVDGEHRYVQFFGK